jgi:hypothetical protein
MSKQLLMVGSMPLDTASEVLETFGKPLGQFLKTIPDGEVGPRRYWISRMHFDVFALHPDLEIIQRPRRDNGVERLVPHDDKDGWAFKVRPGVEQVVFGDPGWRLRYALDAINSYFVFRTLKEKGVLPGHLRFQVSLPMVNSVCALRTFPTPGDLEKVRPGYTEALRAEVATIVSKIPRHDLAIQWDLAREITEINGGVAGVLEQAAFERNLEQVGQLSPHIPEEVELGYHFCFGTMGGWPRFAPKDLGRTVDFANAVTEASGRRVDWIHIPLLDTFEDPFVAPLARLRPKSARVYLGAIHNMERFADRVAKAKKYLADFGVGAYCGLGRMPGSEVPKALSDHIRAADLMTDQEIRSAR